MKAYRSRDRLGAIARGHAWLIVLAVAIVLVLAALQVRDVVEMRAGDLAHLRQAVREKTQGAEWDFNAELARAYAWFRLDPGARDRDLAAAFAAKHAAWQARAPVPRLFRTWSLIADDGRGEPRLARFDPAARRFVAAGWSDEL